MPCIDRRPAILRKIEHGVLPIRPDLRLHRKIVVIDDGVGYRGSFNRVNPRFFKQRTSPPYPISTLFGQEKKNAPPDHQPAPIA